MTEPASPAAESLRKKIDELQLELERVRLSMIVDTSSESLERAEQQYNEIVHRALAAKLTHVETTTESHVKTFRRRQRSMIYLLLAAVCLVVIVLPIIYNRGAQGFGSTDSLLFILGATISIVASTIGAWLASREIARSRLDLEAIDDVFGQTTEDEDTTAQPPAPSDRVSRDAP